MKWFRFYSDALDDPKVQRLPGDLFKTWVNLLCLAAKDDGCLPSTEDIAFALRLSDEQAEAAIAEFTKRGLLDSGEDGMTPHNWQGRQPISDRDPTATERQQRRRSRIASENVTDASRVTPEEVTPLEEIKREEIRVEKKREGTRERAAATPPIPEPAVQIIASLSEITDDKPYGMVAMLCEENGKAVDAMPADWRGMQLAIAKRLLLNHSIEQVRAYVRYRKTAWNGNEPFDLRRVEKDIGAWELAGSPESEPVRAPPKGGGVGQAMDRAADIWEKREQYKNGASNGAGDMAGVHGADQGGVSPIKARVR